MCCIYFKYYNLKKKKKRKKKRKKAARNKTKKQKTKTTTNKQTRTATTFLSKKKKKPFFFLYAINISDKLSQLIRDSLVNIQVQCRRDSYFLQNLDLNRLTFKKKCTSIHIKPYFQLIRSRT